MTRTRSDRVGRPGWRVGSEGGWGYCRSVAEHTPAEPGEIDLDPARARSREEFLASLGRRRVLDGDTYKQLELRTGVPRSTLADMLTRHRTPRREVVRLVVDVYAADRAEAERWVAVWSQLSVREALPAYAVPAGPAPTEDTLPLAPAPATSPDARGPTSHRRWRWAVAGTVVVVLAGAAYATSGALRPGPRVAQSSAAGPVPASTNPFSPAGNGSVTAVRVFNVETDCQRRHSETCALRLAHDPRAVPSIANRAGEVWHDDEILATCTIVDGRAVTDEKLTTSRVWYFVHVPSTDETGWLPGIRVRPAVAVPAC